MRLNMRTKPRNSALVRTVVAEELDSRFRPCSLVGQIPRYRGICP